MPSELIEHDESANLNLIGVGDSSRTVSIKDYQDIYHQVTGRTEQIRKRAPDLLLIDFSEVEQLHTKINQLCDVHNVIAKNLTVSIFHEKERKEQFTSFERFRTYNSNTTSPTIFLVLKYNFSIIPSGIQKAQEYTVTIRLTSRVALLNQMQEETPPFMRVHMLKFISEPAAEITVDYVDYIIARGFIESFEEWVKGCKFTPKNKLVEKAQEYSHFIPPLMRLLSIILVTYFALKAIPKYFLERNSIEILARFAIIFLSGAVVLSSLASFIGSRIERAVDGYPMLSYIHLNKGDQRMIESFETERKSVIRKFLWYCLINFVIAIVATKLEKFI